MFNFFQGRDRNYYGTSYQGPAGKNKNKPSNSISEKSTGLWWKDTQKGKQRLCQTKILVNECNFRSTKVVQVFLYWNNGNNTELLSQHRSVFDLLNRLIQKSVSRWRYLSVACAAKLTDATRKNERFYIRVHGPWLTDATKKRALLDTMTAPSTQKVPDGQKLR